MESATLTQPDQARRPPLWTLLFVLVPLVILIVTIFVMTDRHNAQLMDMTAVHNQQLKKMTEEHNLQRTKMTEEHNAQLAAQAAEFQKRK
ncbi:MAG TPA: hypothetical protein VM533_00820 [Fimbriiglobus sp.]|nr:hypothetical protein [Fimbriiglobus sp.]